MRFAGPGRVAFAQLAAFLGIMASLSAADREYRTGDFRKEGVRVYFLEETQSGSRAEFLPEFGGLCARLRLSHGGTAFEVFPEVNWEMLRKFPTWQGMPVLFPFPGVVPKGEYRFGRRSGRLDPATNSADNYHGFAADSPWTVLGTWVGTDGAFLEMALTPENVGEAERQYPFPFRLVARYRMDSSSLSVDFRIENTGTETLPYALGVHPFLRWPLTAESEKGNSRFRLNASRYWEGAGSGECPVERPVTATNDPRTGLLPTEGNCTYYTGLTPGGDGWAESWYLDGDTGISLRIGTDGNFPIIVFYVPEYPPNTVSIEAYTALPNAINLPPPKNLPTRIGTLDAGAVREMKMAISIGGTLDF